MAGALSILKGLLRGGGRPTQGIFHSTAGSQKLALPTSFAQLLLGKGLRCYAHTVGTILFQGALPHSDHPGCEVRFHRKEKI